MSASPIFKYSAGRLAVSIAAALTLGHCGLASAQPNMQPLGPNIADLGSKAYSFRRFELDSNDGQRHYRVWVGKPDAPAPPGGYAVLYMLDGNAAMNALDEPLLEALGRGAPPVLVAVGYQTELAFDTTARAYDYTPPAANGETGSDPWNPARASGGSDEFRTLLRQRILPEAERGLAIDSAQRSLWGHSYAGLFVLDTLFQAAGDIAHYYAASPSLGWNAGQGLAREALLERRESAEARTLVLFHGGDEVARHQRNADQSAAAQAPQRPSGSQLRAQLSPTAVEELARRLERVAELEVTYRFYPDLSHGPMLAASLRDTLREVAGLPLPDPAQETGTAP